MTTTTTIPTLPEYIAGVRDFIATSDQWYTLSDGFFSVSASHGYYKSCDNAYGGLDVRMFFRGLHSHKPDPTDDEIASVYARERAAYEELIMADAIEEHGPAFAAF